MIQIDDAGSGSLIGGTLIGITRVETGEYYNDIIPIKLYNEKNFKKKLYIKYTCDIIKKNLDILNISREEPIMVCQGYMFDDVRKYFVQYNYNHISTKIESPLQTVIEKAFEDYAISLGVPANFLKYTKYPFHFHRLLRWVYADYDNRVKLCKTGWKSWQKYSNLNTKVENDFLYKSSYHCLKCGRKIHNDSPVKVIRYFSNMPNKIYIHKNCNII